MTYAVLATAAALSSLAGAAIVLSLCATLLAGRASRATEQYAPDRRAALLFRLRVLPGAGAAVAGFLIALPTFIAFEPFETDEPLPRVMMLLTLGGAVLLTRAAWRVYSAARATARTAAEWKRSGRVLADLDTPIPAYAVDLPYPLVAVVGIARPALFIAESVLSTCSAAELRAMIAHEAAHLRAFDNARQFVLRACPDLVPGRSLLTRAWRDAAEQAADADVARTREQALDLAQALIRVARLTPPCAPALASAFFSGGSIDARVRRLVNPPADSALPVVLGGWTLAIATAALAGVCVLGASTIHQLMEAVVRFVP